MSHQHQAIIHYSPDHRDIISNGLNDVIDLTLETETTMETCNEEKKTTVIAPDNATAGSSSGGGVKRRLTARMSTGGRVPKKLKTNK